MHKDTSEECAVSDSARVGCCAGIVDSASGILGKDHDQAEVHENACRKEYIPYHHAVMTWMCGLRVHVVYVVVQG